MFADSFDYLLGRASTHDLALQLAYVYDPARPSTPRSVCCVGR
jgi:hypothetical protein